MFMFVNENIMIYIVESFRKIKKDTQIYMLVFEADSDIFSDINKWRCYRWARKPDWASASSLLDYKYSLSCPQIICSSDFDM